MRKYLRNNAFHRDVNQKYAPETDIFCSVCGDGIYPDEAVSWYDQNQICHTECLEEEHGE